MNCPPVVSTPGTLLTNLPALSRSLPRLPRTLGRRHLPPRRPERDWPAGSADPASRFRRGRRRLTGLVGFSAGHPCCSLSPGSLSGGNTNTEHTNTENTNTTAANTTANSVSRAAGAAAAIPRQSEMVSGRPAAITQSSEMQSGSLSYPASYRPAAIATAGLVFFPLH
jgi:hypothetical protein